MDAEEMFRSCLESCCSSGNEVSLETLRTKLGMSRLLFNHVESVFRKETNDETKSNVCVSVLLPLLERLLNDENNLSKYFSLLNISSSGTLTPEEINEWTFDFLPKVTATNITRLFTTPVSQEEFIKICTSSITIFDPTDLFKKIWIDAFFTEKEVPSCLLPRTFQLEKNGKSDKDDNSNADDDFPDDTTTSSIHSLRITIKPEDKAKQSETKPTSSVFDHKLRLENTTVPKKKRAYAKLSADALFAKNRPISSTTCFEHFQELSEVESTMKEALELLEQEKFEQSLAAIKLAIVMLISNEELGKKYKEQLSNCAIYYVALSLLLKIQESIKKENFAFASFYSCYLLTVPIDPIYRSAIARICLNTNMRSQNFGIANKLLEKMLNSGSQPHDADVLRKMQDVCAKHKCVDRSVISIDCPCCGKTFNACELNCPQCARGVKVDHQTFEIINSKTYYLCNICSTAHAVKAACPICFLGTAEIQM